MRGLDRAQDRDADSGQFIVEPANRGDGVPDGSRQPTRLDEQGVDLPLSDLDAARAVRGADRVRVPLEPIAAQS